MADRMRDRMEARVGGAARKSAQLRAHLGVRQIT